MAQQQPAVIFVARHGSRLDAANPSWHHSTPTPYDPPLTYGGWNQCRSLGARIASLLHAREQSLNSVSAEESVASKGLGQLNENGKRKGSINGDGARKRRRVKHKVVIHTSPFLRCVQTSVAIAAGMGQYHPTIETGGKKTPGVVPSASPRLRAVSGHASPNLAPNAEPKLDLAHQIAQKMLHEHKSHEHKKHRKAKVRVDAFLGEWLNPEYFDGITAPPPSAMMLATAKAELMQNEAVEVFTPTLTTKSSGGSLWGSANGSATPSRDSTLDDWSHMQDNLPPSPGRRSRSNSQDSSVGSNSDGRKSPSQRHRAGLQPLTSTISKVETAIYSPPTPQYAVSTSDTIPRGYFAHARNACTHVDYQWDSSRAPQDWGDGGDLGEEWSSMHRRFRKGLNNLIQWYSQRDTDDRGEDALGFEQADHRKDTEVEEQEDLVIVMVTHGAGCNALIGAMTGQPVLIDVGMASLTMAVRRDDAPPLSIYSPQQPTNGLGRRGSLDMPLASLYDMKITASVDHLRPQGASASISKPSSSPRENGNGYRDPERQFSEPINHHRSSNTNSTLGTIRRPLANHLGPVAAASEARSSSLPPGSERFTPPRSGSGGLWAPPARSQPAQVVQAKVEENGGNDMVLDFSNSPDHSRPGTSSGEKGKGGEQASAAKFGAINGLVDGARNEPRNEQGVKDDRAANSGVDLSVAEGDGSVSLDKESAKEKEGLWGNKTNGGAVGKVKRSSEGPKRRWTVDRQD